MKDGMTDGAAVADKARSRNPWICPESSMRPTRIELATFGLKGQWSEWGCLAPGAGSPDSAQVFCSPNVAVIGPNRQMARSPTETEAPLTDNCSDRVMAALQR